MAARSAGHPEQIQDCETGSKAGGINWYFNATFHGDAYAMYALGKMYANGVGVDQNDTKAASWYSKASSAGIAYAHYELAKACRDGTGVDEDPEFADALFKKALKALTTQEAEYPDPHAKYILATIYELGLGVEKDFEMAERWRVAAAGIPSNQPKQPENAVSKFPLPSSICFFGRVFANSYGIGWKRDADQP